MYQKVLADPKSLAAGRQGDSTTREDDWRGRMRREAEVGAIPEVIPLGPL